MPGLPRRARPARLRDAGRRPGPAAGPDAATRPGPAPSPSTPTTPIAADAPAVRSLQSLERDVETQPGPPRRPPTARRSRSTSCKDREAFTHFLTFYYPELPPRRAFFLAQGTRRVVYTFYNDRLDEDLRHEATHALLHVAVGDLPLWLDEGLAEYFEGPEGRQGLNPEHLARLPDDLEAGWKPDLARLETLQDVREMTPRDYRESWAWVHYLLNGPVRARTALLAYLADSKTSPLSARLPQTDRGDAQRMLAHLGASARHRVASSVGHGRCDRPAPERRDRIEPEHSPPQESPDKVPGDDRAGEIFEK